MNHLYPIKRALVSVSDKSQLLSLAATLKSFQIEIISSGGTRAVLENEGFEVTPIEKVTGNPEAFDGRMKTLSFQVMSSLLFRRESPQDLLQAKELNIQPIDLVVCHLYPFEKVMREQGDLAELIENIDIGGPTMLRAAAKNYQHVCVCPDPSFYQELINELNHHQGKTTLSFRQQMALRTLRHTARYDATITAELEKQFEDQNQSFFLSSFEAKELRYGENPHQKAHLILDSKNSSAIDWSNPLQGKELSYNNLWDADQAYRCANDLVLADSSRAHTVIVKHANPCGLCSHDDPVKSLELAWSCDPVSSFGSILATSREFNEDQAQWLSDKFVEIILAPSFSSKALEILSQKKNLRLLQVNYQANDQKVSRKITGGWIMQDEDDLPSTEWQWVSKERPKTNDQGLSLFGLIACKHLRSNAIALVQMIDGGYLLTGAGMGNPNRLVSVKQAFEKAHESGFREVEKMQLISDAFFPFDDNIVLAHQYGVKEIIQPGGSIKDKEVIATVDRLGMSMAMTGKRHFRH